MSPRPSPRAPHRASVLFALAVFTILAAPSRALAQDIVNAEALFHSGLADMEAGRYETGCKALAESQRIEPRAGTLFTLAACEERWGHIATAVTRFGDYIALYQRLPEDRREAQAARYKVAVETRDKLAPEVPKWTLSLPKGAPNGTIVKRDGEVLPAPALGISLPVDPGDHILSTEVPGGSPLEKKVTILRGQTLVLVLEVAVPKVAAPPFAGSAAATAGPRDSGAPTPRRWSTYMIGGVGIAGLVAGGVMGGLVLERKGIVDAHCGAAIGQADAGACDKAGLTAANESKGIGLGSTFGFALGGVALGTALVLFLTEPRTKGSAALRPSASIWPGAFLSPGALRLGPAGAMLGAEGRF